ncbi:MAG: prepilin-type N-terminal cleavage/methylation domain-containing protein [Alphaproteobacteria bacterium]|nr:prepilin-type N-terminal cleavage/methylation domain-containing protein [Alphaproteobacteria bacterium]
MIHRQRGFTIIELLFASAATGIIILAASAFMLKSLSWYDELSAKIEINRHARETYNLLAFGGKSASTGKDGTKYLYGLRGFNKAPGNGLRTSTNALQFTSNKLTLTPDSFATMSVTCTGSGTPIPDCKDNHSSQSVSGWIGSDIKLDDGPKGVNNLTAEVTFTITDAFQAQRANGTAAFTDTYYTSFTLNRDEDDPH